MALNDIFEIVHDMTFLGKTILNVYHAERAGAGENSGTVNEAWQNSVLPAIRAFQTTFVINNEMRTFNLGISTDFVTSTLVAAPGLRANVASPRFVAPGIRFATTDRDVRSGYKRYAGGSEVDYTDGILTAGAIALMDAITAALTGGWLASSDSHLVANFIVVKRVCKTVDPVSGKCLVYRLPETDAELKFFQPTQGVVQLDVTSQVSRK